MKRRDFLLAAAAGISSLANLPLVMANSSPFLTRLIPPSGESIPAIGMGTWITFDAGFSNSAIQKRVEVLRHFFIHGGGMIDSSPMYGSSEAVVGKCLAQIDYEKTLFSATKVWTPGRWLGVKQMEHSKRLWGLKNFDLMQIHNLVDWDTHIKTLIDWKESGYIRYIGVTTSHGRRHEKLIDIIKNEPLDFVQFTYNIVDREAENTLLPLAADQGIAVIINRPFRRGQLFDIVNHQLLPDWAKDIGCNNWAQFFLKFIISHPSVTVAIPATSQVSHMDENMGAMSGPLPNKAMRKKMLELFHSL